MRLFPLLGFPVLSSAMLIFAPWLLCMPLAAPAPQHSSPTKVACLGDSITWGSRVVDREHNAYPVQLGHILGHEWQVRNFGSGGKTLLTDGDTPYAESDAYQQLLAWGPDVTLVMLGTNDTCQDTNRQNWTHQDSLERDALSLAKSILAEETGSRVILCSPPPMFPDAQGLGESRTADLNERQPRLQRIASALRTVSTKDSRIEFLDLSSVLQSPMTVDGVHTTPFGAHAIAKRTAEAVQQELVPALDWTGSATAPSGEFHGFTQHAIQLKYEGGSPIQARIVEPHQPAAGTPWIWRARFFGHEPELDKQLLARGYHVAYCDVAGLFGSDLALERWDTFYRFCVEQGLSERVLLEGMSRGGLVALNWAARRPEAVEGIYLDNPVCDFRSWPGHQRGTENDQEWQNCLKAYGLRPEQADAYASMPLDRLAPLAKGQVPIFLVQSGADTVVPGEANGEELVRRFRKLGGSIQVWPKPGSNHHPHGLHPVQPLLRALLKAGGQGVNPASHPVPSAEYRGSPAGWGGGTWWDQLAKLTQLAERNPDASLVFLGDSITQGLSGNSDRVGHAEGTRAFDRFPGALSLGLSGDRTEHLLYRIRYGALSQIDPRLIVLQIGVNNVNSAGHTGTEIAGGLSSVIQSLLTHEPGAEILICGPFPTGPTAQHPRRRALDQVHVRASDLSAQDRVHYLDLRPLFLDETGLPNKLMRGDAIHITGEGVKAWMDAITPLVRKLLDA